MIALFKDKDKTGSSEATEETQTKTFQKKQNQRINLKDSIKDQNICLILILTVLKKHCITGEPGFFKRLYLKRIPGRKKK